MPKRKKKFIKMDEFQDKEMARKLQEEEDARKLKEEARNRKLSLTTPGLVFSSVAKIGLCEKLQSLDSDSSSDADSKITSKYNIEEILQNPDMINDLLKAIGKENCNKSINDLPYVLQTMEKTSEEYKMLENWSGKIEITSIDKIYNPYLLLQYELQKLKYDYKGWHYENKLFYHGTRKNNIGHICSTNFNWRLKGTFTGNRYGQGTSFTPFTGYAMRYGDENSLMDKVMLGVNVIVGNSCLGDENTIVPPDQYDTTHKEELSVFVKYDDNTFNPKYLIHYYEEMLSQ